MFCVKARVRRQDEEGDDRRTEFLVFDGKLRLWGESAGAARWLERVRGAEELGAALLRFSRSDLDTEMIDLEFGEIRITRLGTRRARFVVELPVTTRTTRNAILSRAQAMVARRAAEGITIREIARALRRSPDTVRSHLREAYRRLHVANRVELARALAVLE